MRKPSEIIKEKLLENRGSAIVYSMTGKSYEIRSCNDGCSFVCDQLPIKPPYTYDVFDVIVDLLVEQGGRAEKGAGRSAKLGEPRCEESTIVGAIAKKYAGKSEGESVFDPVFVMAAVLEWAGIAHNERGYVELTTKYRAGM
jgi:hypothetical protein